MEKHLRFISKQKSHQVLPKKRPMSTVKRKKSGHFSKNLGAVRLATPHNEVIQKIDTSGSVPLL